MSAIEQTLRDALADLASLGRDFALVGGFAVSAWAEPRTTRDVDLAVVVHDDADAEQLVFQLAQRGYSMHASVERIEKGRLATARLRAANGRVVDLLMASSGIESEIVAAAAQLEIIGGLTTKVARIGHLIGLKVLARDDRTRPQDRVDLAALLAVADDDELDRARVALRLITSRGYDRGRSLEAELDRTIDELGPA